MSVNKANPLYTDEKLDSSEDIEQEPTHSEDYDFSVECPHCKRDIYFYDDDLFRGMDIPEGIFDDITKYF